MKTSRLVQGLSDLPRSDKRLLKGFAAIAVLSLALGLVYGAITALGRTGLVPLETTFAYRTLTLHGVTVFFYWLYFTQAAVVLILACVYTEGADGVAWRPVAWAGLALMTVGFVVSQMAPIMGAIMLYDGQPGLVDYDKSKGSIFYLGYLFLSVGLLLVGTVAIATALKPRFQGKAESWSAVSFASVAWAGLLLVSAMAAIHAFLPGALWTFGLDALPSNYTTRWHVLFHNVHYLPLMATVLIWYVLVEEITGVKSIFGARYSKIVFSLYLILVPPTSLYHMFLEPGLSDVVRVLGSLLSLFIGIPTVLVFLIIVSSLETHARSKGARGLFGWVRMLPWQNPAMAAMGMSVVNCALGGALAFVLIQSQFAPFLSDTFFVPGYFHFLTLGTVTLTFIAAFMYVIPGLTGRALWRPKLLARSAYAMTFGLLIFGGAGIAAGYLGVPRRAFEMAYGSGAPQSWQILMIVVGVGAVIMSATLAIYVYGLARTLIGRAAEVGKGAPVGLSSVTWGGVAIGRQSAWVGPLSVVVLVAIMYVFTVLSFELLEAVPVVAKGSAAH